MIIVIDLNSSNSMQLSGGRRSVQLAQWIEPDKDCLLALLAALLGGMVLK